MARYQGVDVDHPTIVNTIKNMIKQGEPKEKICRVVGMPPEVVEKHIKAAEREKEGRSGR